MQKTFYEKRIIGKIHSFCDRIFEDKNLFIFRKYRFLKVVEQRECIGNGVVFTRDKVNVRVELFNVIEMMWSGVVLLVVMLRWLVWMNHSKEHCTKLG